MPAHFGLDIGSSSIKLLEVKGKEVVSIGMAVNPIGKNDLNLVPKEKNQLAEAVSGLIKESKVKTRTVIMSVPESQVFTRVMSLPVMSTPEIASSIKWELDQVVPYPPDKIETSWAVMYKPKKNTGAEKIQVLVVAIPKNVSQSYVEFLALVGLEPLRVENEVVSLVRGVGGVKYKEETILIMDMGASATKLAISEGGRIFNTHVIPIAGMALTRMIAESFKLNLSQAEQYKRVYGIDASQVEGKIVQATSGLMSGLVTEIKKVMSAFAVAETGRQLSKLVLTGGSAYLKGLMPFLVDNLALEVVLADGFEGVKVAEKSKNLGPVFGVVRGLTINED